VYEELFFAIAAVRPRGFGAHGSRSTLAAESIELTEPSIEPKESCGVEEAAIAPFVIEPSDDPNENVGGEV